MVGKAAPTAQPLPIDVTAGLEDGETLVWNAAEGKFVPGPGASESATTPEAGKSIWLDCHTQAATFNAPAGFTGWPWVLMRNDAPLSMEYLDSAASPYYDEPGVHFLQEGLYQVCWQPRLVGNVAAGRWLRLVNQGNVDWDAVPFMFNADNVELPIHTFDHSQPVVWPVTHFRADDFFSPEGDVSHDDGTVKVKKLSSVVVTRIA